MSSAQLFVKKIIHNLSFIPSFIDEGYGEAPVNIALCKYWGKRSSILNLPNTSSLSISIPDLGAKTVVRLRAQRDEIYLNNLLIDEKSSFYQQINSFLNNFRVDGSLFFEIRTEMNIPHSAGLASSACGFAALTKALNNLFKWELSAKELSMIARLGSGSASRSIEQGVVLWHAGSQIDGLDSYSELLSYDEPSMRVGLILVDQHQKQISSRAAMNKTVGESRLYKNWPCIVQSDLTMMLKAFESGNTELIYQIAERNALAMHATMLDLNEPIMYDLEETMTLKKKIWLLRKKGIGVYFTQDAGPNLKLLFDEKFEEIVLNEFSLIQVYKVFEKTPCFSV
jgi:diphosphomevalonate decarboxylase